MTPVLKHDRGTLVLREVPEVIAHLFTWDARAQTCRAPGQSYREVCELLRGQLVAYKDEAASFQKLELKFAREITPYLHQTEAHTAWVRAGRQGVVVLPTGSGKTLVAQLAMQSTPRSALICVPTIDLLHQWYSGLMAAFPDANIGLLGGGSHDETPILISTYDSAARYAEELAGKYALLICDEVHHLPSDFSRVIAEMSLAPYRLGLTATPKRGDGRERDLDTLLGPILQRHRDTEASKTFLTRLLREYDVPEVIHTDQLRSYGAAIREIPSLINVDHQQVVSTARCNNVIEQRASVASRAVLPKTIPPNYTTSGSTTTGIQTEETRSRVLEPAYQNRQPSPSYSHQRFRLDQKKRAGVLKGVCSAQEATKSKRSGRGQRLRQGRSEVQTAPALSLP